MRKLIQNVVPAAVALALLGAPGAVAAQEEAAEAETTQECTLEIAPTGIEAGKAAVQVTASFSSDIGAVRELAAPEGSGIALAAPESLALVEIARGEAEEGEEAPEPRPIVMAGDAARATVWLSTEEARPGTYLVTLKGAAGECSGELTVTEGETEGEGASS